MYNDRNVIVEKTMSHARVVHVIRLNRIIHTGENNIYYNNNNNNYTAISTQLLYYILQSDLNVIFRKL